MGLKGNGGIRGMDVPDFDRDRFIERLHQMQRPLQFAARQNFTKLTVLQDLETRLLEWLDTACALQPPADIRANLDACRRLFTGFDAAEPVVKRRAIIAALGHIDDLIARASQPSSPVGTPGHESPAAPAGHRAPTSAPLPGDPANLLGQSMQFVRGVGPLRAQMLRRLGIETVEDALALLPRRYEDRANLKAIRHLEVGQQETFTGTILVSGSSRTGRGRRLYEIIVGDATGTIRCLWFQFQEKYMRQRYGTGRRVIVSGEVRQSPYQAYRREVHHPDLERLDDDEQEPLHVGRIVPVHPSTEGLPQKTLRAIMKRVVDDYAKEYPEYIPSTIRQRLQLMSASQALQEVHFPSPEADLEQLKRWASEAHRRLIFEEFFVLELGLALRQRETVVEERRLAYRGTGELVARLHASLPFQLTAAQERVLAEICADMRRPHPMNRLLQGDVGSGKTIVALLAMLLAIESGFQTAIMAPTEILAEQHHLTMRELAAPLGVRVTLLTSALKGARRRRAQAAIGAGDVDLIVGTHALIQEEVAFKSLGLVVIDEQHRFGVLQRAMLKKKGYNPDVLVMTATPIPRTLAMTVYGDLDVSIIDELPPGRLPVVTRVCYDSRRAEAYELMRRELRLGHQVYVVYPLIEESEKVELRAAVEMAEHLHRDVFPEYRLGLLHGRLRSEEKEQIMRAFSTGALDILVSTTVIEVGVDIPNATVILVEHAERFGLAQLHQLRGRVGRGGEQAYCLLMAHFPMSEEARQRLNALTESHDGFAIAERDLEIRGPGEFLGTRQSGLPELRVAHLIRDQRILVEARREAFSLIARDPSLVEPENAALRGVLGHRWQRKFELMSVG
jgi:ATP-dependent DNA helicase RecG